MIINNKNGRFEVSAPQFNFLMQNFEFDLINKFNVGKTNFIKSSSDYDKARILFSAKHYTNFHKPSIVEQFESPQYGKFWSRKVGAVDMISARKEGKLKECTELWWKMQDRIYGRYRSRKLAEENLANGHQYLSKFEIYIPFDKDNKGWEDSKGYIKKMPLIYTDNEWNKILDYYESKS